MFPVYDALLIVIVTTYLFFTPFTKVEESFNIQAIHDIIFYGFDVSKFDHIEFPGAVPRTFIGSLVVAYITKPIFNQFPRTASKLDGQLATRGILGLINSFSVLFLKNAVVSQFKVNAKASQKTEPKVVKNTKGKKRASKAVVENTELHSTAWFSVWFALLQFTQFHFPFYASRTLPNFLALPLTNYAFSKLIKGQFTKAIAVFAFTSIVFRIELAALTLSVALVLFRYKRITIPQIIKAGLTGGIIGALLSLSVDSYFWRRWTIPELESLFFNVVQGKSSEWGTEPFGNYFSKYLLNLFAPPIIPILAVLGYTKDPTGIDTLKISGISSVLYVLILSFQPHKEWRFIIYIVPIITLLGANGASIVSTRAKKSHVYKLLVLTIFFGSLTSLVVSAGKAYVSYNNYGGGFAFNAFQERMLMRKYFQKIDDPVYVHIDVGSSMTGISRFCELNELANITITYDKTEDPEKLTELWPKFTHLISTVDVVQGDRKALPRPKGYKWKQLDRIKSFAGIDRRGFQTIDLPKTISKIISQRSYIPILEAFAPFLRVEELFFVYEKVPILEKNTSQKST